MTRTKKFYGTAKAVPLSKRIDDAGSKGSAAG
jgi:hypothetical protein